MYISVLSDHVALHIMTHEEKKIKFIVQFFYLKMTQLLKTIMDKIAAPPGHYNKLRDTANSETLLLEEENKYEGEQWVLKYVSKFKRIDPVQSVVPVIDLLVDGPFHTRCITDVYFINKAAFYAACGHLNSVLDQGDYFKTLAFPEGISSDAWHLTDDMFIIAQYEAALARPDALMIVTHAKSEFMTWVRKCLDATISSKTMNDMPIDKCGQLLGMSYVPAEMMHFFCSTDPTHRAFLESNWIQLPLWAFMGWMNHKKEARKREIHEKMEASDLIVKKPIVTSLV